jgi:hypothetical protein
MTTCESERVIKIFCLCVNARMRTKEEGPGILSYLCRHSTIRCLPSIERRRRDSSLNIEFKTQISIDTQLLMMVGVQSGQARASCGRQRNRNGLVGRMA